MEAASYEMLCHQSETKRWHECRRQLIGGSEVAAALGVHPWESALSVYARKTGGMPEKQTNQAMRIGQFLESSVAELATQEVTTLKGFSMDGYLRRSRRWPWLGATRDVSWLFHDATHTIPGEIKVSGRSADWEEGPPPWVLAQVQHQMAVDGEDVTYVAALLGGTRFGWYEVPRDEDAIAEGIEAARRLWECIEKRTPPAPDGSQASEDALRAIFPDRGTSRVIQDEKVLELDSLFLQTQQQLKEAKAAHEKSRQAVIALLGADSEVQLPDGTRYRYRESLRKAYTVPEASVRSLRRLKALE